MAQPAMTPDEALQTIAGIRAYRERLTSRAAGIVWIVWGTALTLLSFQSLYVEFPKGAGLVPDGYPYGAWLELAGVVIAVALGGFLTNVVWRAHALEQDRQHRAWIPYAAGLGAILFVSLLIVISNTLAAGAGVQIGPHGILFSPLALVAATGAVTIAALQRKRVRMLPGLLAALVLLNLFLFARFIAFPQDAATQFWGGALFAWAPAIVFTAVGLWTMRQA